MNCNVMINGCVHHTEEFSLALSCATAPPTGGKGLWQLKSCDVLQKKRLLHLHHHV